ncbi:MAG TPA: carboxypeptidase-like regulatory domain-containing protein [Solirubrobacteraceae bacterium]|nr:carboxypeptidase-like regulatory domain-containing protein [Solirubrobacteraceae bacterium]
MRRSCGRSDLRAPLLLALLTLAIGVLGVATPAGAEEPPDQPLPLAVSLGPPPEPCFPYGGSHSICPEEGFANPDPPDYMAATYYGTLAIENHIVHVGDDISMSAEENNKGEPGWSEGGPIVSGCKDATETGGVRTPAETNCVWKAEGSSPYPPSEASTGWKSGWEVLEISFCGFFGCAPSGDYYYVIGNEQAISGYVLDSAGKAAMGAFVAIQGEGTNVAAQVNPETGFYNALVPPGSYNVSVEREGPEAYTFGAGKVTTCTGEVQGPDCEVNVSEHTAVASFEVPLVVTGVKQPSGPVEGGKTVHIFGEGFDGASAVNFLPKGGGTALAATSFTVDSDSEITAVTPNATSALPKGSKSLATDVQVTNNGATSPLNPPGDEYKFGNLHKLTVDALEGSETSKPVEGIKFVFASNAGGETVEGTTNEKGEVSEELTEGSYNVKATPAGAAVPLTGTENPACLVQEASCGVNLNEDRTVKFTTCVVPNPNGSPLPTTTPNPIPGAITAGQLEAVGCWTPQNASGKGEATIYHSTQPVRLDGIDVKPLSGTTLQLDKSGPTVTSDGPAQVLVDGWPIVGGLVPAFNIELNYQAGSQLSVGDQGAGTGPLAPNLFGLPISLGTGGPAGYGLPFSESPGQTTISGGLQIPLNTDAIWSVEKGVFVEPEASESFNSGSFIAGNATVPSIGLGGSIIMTNRLGLTGKVCASVNDVSTEFLFPFPRDGFDDGEISGAQLCWSSAQDLWEGSAMFKLPSALARYVGDIFVKLTAQKAKPAEQSTVPQFEGYKLQNFGLQFEHLESNTYVVPGLASVRSSGIPIGDGFFLQSLGGEFSNDLKTGKVSEIKGTAGISFGPEVNINTGNTRGTELSILRGDLEATILPPTPEEESWSYRLGGALTVGRLSPLELQLAAAKITYHARPEKHNPEADFFGQIGGSLLGTGGALTVTGQSDESHGLLLEGTATAKAFGHLGTLDVILNNYRLGVCLTTSGGTALGFVTAINEPKEAFEWGCNLGSFQHPTGATASAAHRTEHLRIRRGLPATVLAVRGAGAAPRVRLSGPGGPGTTITATPTAHPQAQDGAIVFADPVKHITYIGLIHPRAGRWTVSSPAGSPAIAEVLQAVPRSAPKVRAHVVRDGCSDELRYRVHATGGDRILVYAQQGSGHVYVGQLHAGAGALKLGLLSRVKGRGELVAYYLRGATPQGTAKLASFGDAASNGSERPSHLKLHAGTLRWQAACAAASYSVALTRAGKTTTQSTTKPELALTAAAGRTLVSVTALTSGGLTLGATHRMLP